MANQLRAGHEGGGVNGEMKSCAGIIRERCCWFPTWRAVGKVIAGSRPDEQSGRLLKTIQANLRPMRDFGRYLGIIFYFFSGFVVKIFERGLQFLASSVRIDTDG